MRDIRGDLQDRADFLEEQIGTAQQQFEKRMERFALEHEAKIGDLQAELEAVTMLLEREYRRIMGRPDVDEERRQPAVRPAQEAQRPAAAAPAPYQELEASDEEPKARPVREAYREPADEEPARPAAAVEEEAPVRRAPEPQYAPRPAAREDEEYRRPAAAEARPQRPVPVEQPAPESRPAAAQGYSRPAARISEPRPQPERLHEPERRPAAAPSQQPPLADFLIRKLGEAGTMTLDDLCNVAIHEGYFAEGDNPDRTVHMTLMNVVKAGFIRQMPNGTFAPASVMDTIRLRRAI